ncbi:MAG: amidohydrolase family protein, partial [Myxococcota bacterium]
MEKFDGLLFDCDNHYYEAEDAFTRHVPRRMQKRCVQWVEMEGKRYHLVAGKLNKAVGNPTFNPISKPGVLREYYHGNADGKTFIELTRSALEPMPPEYMDRDARVARVEEQG